MVSYEYCFLNMWIDPDINLMYSEWLCLPSRQEFMQGVKISEEILSKYEVYYWIMDSTKLAAMPVEDQREAMVYISHIMATSTLKKIARIVPKDNTIINFFEETLQEAKNKVNSSLEIDRFHTYKAAADWIGKVSC